MRDNLSVFISLNSSYFKTNEFISNKVLDQFQDPNIVYIPLSQDSFRNLFNTELGLTDSENAENIMKNLTNFFNPAIYNNNVTFANQLADILRSFYADIQVNIDKLATDLSSQGGPLFSYFFQSNSSNYTKYEKGCFDTDIDYLEYKHVHDPENCVICQPLEIDSSSLEVYDTVFNGEYIASNVSQDIIYLLASQLKGAITLFAEDYSEQDFWNNIMPSDSISVHSKLFVPSSENSNELNLVIKFHVIRENYSFTLPSV